MGTLDSLRASLDTISVTAETMLATFPQAYTAVRSTSMLLGIAQVRRVCVGRPFLCSKLSQATKTNKKLSAALAEEAVTVVSELVGALAALGRGRAPAGDDPHACADVVVRYTIIILSAHLSNQSDQLSPAHRTVRSTPGATKSDPGHP
jgi:hypothetical protein